MKLQAASQPPTPRRGVCGRACISGSATKVLKNSELAARRSPCFAVHRQRRRAEQSLRGHTNHGREFVDHVGLVGEAASDRRLGPTGARPCAAHHRCDPGDARELLWRRPERIAKAARKVALAHAETDRKAPDCDVGAPPKLTGGSDHKRVWGAFGQALEEKPFDRDYPLDRSVGLQEPLVEAGKVGWREDVAKRESRLGKITNAHASEPGRALRPKANHHAADCAIGLDARGSGADACHSIAPGIHESLAARSAQTNPRGRTEVEADDRRNDRQYDRTRRPGIREIGVPDRLDNPFEFGADRVELVAWHGGDRGSSTTTRQSSRGP